MTPVPETVRAARMRTYRPSLSAATLALLCAAWIATVDNAALWRALAGRIDLSATAGIGYAASLGAVIVLVVAVPMLVLGQRALLKPVLVGFLVLSGGLAYFTGQLGIVFDKEMLRNLAETVADRNTQEGLELVSPAMFASLALTTLVPILFVAWVRVRERAFVADQASRLGHAAALVAVVAVLVLVNFKSVSYVSRENDDLEALLTPWYPLKSLDKLVRANRSSGDRPFEVLGADAVQRPRTGVRRIGVMVVGETARADHWALNGYARDTNPELSTRNIVNFGDVRSCGTSTAYSVPCMFSFLDEDGYTPEKAAVQSNALDVLATAGVDVYWIDSNSSCKGVCDRLPNENLMRSPPDPESPLWVDGAYQDEYLVARMDERLDAMLARGDGDVLIVLHTMGSHGPAYYRRYPEALGAFQPACRSKAPQDCPTPAIVNAYDNTILYTDRVLAALIDRLAARAEPSFLLYASDHGESLGENGIYLHGLPKSIAPVAQRHVPMVAWFSDAMADEIGDAAGADGVRQEPRELSHDNLSSTLLGLFDVDTSLHRPALDLFPAAPTASRRASS